MSANSNPYGAFAPQHLKDKQNNATVEKDGQGFLEKQAETYK